MLGTHSIESAGRVGAWTDDPGFGVYVHIPFCRHRCHYCDFNTYENQNHLHEEYVAALITSVERFEGETPAATSVFFGGGTPTLLPPASLGRVLEAVRTRIGVDPDAEITVEANPETVDRTSFAGLQAAGFNRVSIGVQSLVPHVLQGLGRAHSVDRALAAIHDARTGGFDNVNADLIYGSPWETSRDWQATLRGILDVGPEHISAYALTVEQGTPLATLVTTGRVADVDPDVQADRMEIAQEMLEAAGYVRYEISNWARPGRASVHNTLYWCGGEYLGFGAGAHGHLGGRRYWNRRLPRDFIASASVGEAEAGGEILDPGRRAGETMMLGLRLMGGIDVSAFERKWPGAYARRREAVGRLAEAGLLTMDREHLKLTPRGTQVASEVASLLL